MTTATQEATGTASQNGGPEQEPEPIAALGDMHLFLPDDYEVTEVKYTLGGINIDGEDWLGSTPQVGDEFDLVIHNAKVTGAKPTHKGEVTLILTGDNLERR